MGPTRPLISKIAPPELPKVVWRDALFETLDQKAHYSVTWISGMAGPARQPLSPAIWKAENFRISGIGSMTAIATSHLFPLRRHGRKKGHPPANENPCLF